MARRYGQRGRRMVRGMLAAALLGVPAASGAATWVGWSKQEVTCPGQGTWMEYSDFTLVMEPGSGVGTLTIAGFPGQQVLTDWMIDGNWARFVASALAPEDGAPLVIYGMTHGHKMKGLFVEHEYSTGCLVVGKLKAWD